MGRLSPWDYGHSVLNSENEPRTGSETTATATYSVLIVDDEPEFRSWLRRHLEDSGLMRVVGVVSDATQALELVGEEHPDLVLADVHMPGQDGFDLARAVHQLNPSIRVILISARSERVYSSMASQEQALFLPKLGLSADAIVSALEAETAR